MRLLEQPHIREKLAALVADTIPDPGGRLTTAAATHEDAHAQIQRTLALDTLELTARRARNRLRKLKALTRILDRTDHVCTSEVPCRAERHRLIDPVLAELAKLAHRPTPARHRDRMKTPPTTKEIPMSDARTTGRVIDEPPEETARREQAEAARRAAAEVRGVPDTLVPYLRDFDNCWRVAQTEAVREHRAREMAKAILNQPERDRAPLVAWLIHRLARRGVR